MRNFLIWTLSILLGFEPALFAQGQANRQADIKAFLEATEIGKKPQTLTQFYNRMSTVLSRDERESLRPFLKEFGNSQLPQFNIRQIKEGKSEVYQLQAVQDGQAVTMELIGGTSQFMRLNGKMISSEDMKSVPTLMAKIGVPQKDVAKFFPSPNKSQNGFLTADQILKLPKSAQIQYFKNLRDLLESMEAVDHSQKPKKTAMNSSVPPQLEVISRWLQGEEAFAEFVEGDYCVAGGHLARVKRDKARGLTCGSDGNGGVMDAYRKKADGSFCPQGSFSCNPVIYGNQGECNGAGPDTTKKCNQLANEKGSDLPDLATSKLEFWEWRREAMEKAQQVKDHCDQVFGSSSAADKRNLEIDQRQTCANFNERYEKIKSWDCNLKSSDFATKYPKYCTDPISATPGEKPPAPPGSPEAVPATPATPNAGPKILNCDQLPPNQAKVGTKCEYGQVLNTDNIYCLEGDKQILVTECTCEDGKPITKGTFKCDKPKKSKDGSDGKSSKKKKGPNWLLIGGLGLGGLFLFHWLMKRSVKENYKGLEPVPQNPPLPAPTLPAPTPRTGTQ
ncbi:MAG: hypothetical protein ACAH59_01825 [Pseudobdellovibrionaceae bacterium]